MGRKGKAYSLGTDPMASLIPPEGNKNCTPTFALKILNFSFVCFHSLACLLKQTNRFTFICLALLNSN